MTTARQHPECRRDRGFTLIELLVAVIIIGILAAIAIPAYLDLRDKAFAKASLSNMRNTVPEVFTARENSQQAFRLITGSGCSQCPCRGATPVQVKDPGFAATSCGVNWRNVVDRLSAASGATVPSMEVLLTDGWGYPILPDENEGEGGCTDNRPDVLYSGGKDHVHFNADDITVSILSSPFC